LYAGMVAVPVPLADKSREAARLLAILANARPCGILCAGDSSRLEEQARAAGLDRAPFVRSLPAVSAEAERASPRLPRPEELAFIQYTSGSLGLPNGAMVSHGNLVANERMIQRGFEHDSSSTFVGWLPHFHDMGLIGNILQPFFIDSSAVLMSPNAFVRDPLRWLELISQFRARTSGAPNIAYELCALRAARSKTPLELDLSSWDLAFVGAEPVRAQTMATFAKTFAPYGFRATALFPCYGLAETTLFVSGVKKGAGVYAHSVRGSKGGAQKRNPIVSCGAPAEGQRLRIVNPETFEPCAPGEEGEIWISGPHVATGYWGRPEESARAFQARLPADPNDYLRTGDLGALVEGDVLITGRLKDLIIVHGQNIYPQDVEETVEGAHRALRRGCSAAFSIDGARGEEIVVVAEGVRAHAAAGWAEVINAIRETLAREQELAVALVVLIPPQSIHKTSSGKIQRRSVRRALLDGSLDILAQSGSLNAPSKAIAVPLNQ
jgi:acyl-CoA synthetase (AMP-forming)/AMP-acid ligase II